MRQEESRSECGDPEAKRGKCNYVGGQRRIGSSATDQSRKMRSENSPCGLSNVRVNEDVDQQFQCSNGDEGFV